MITNSFDGACSAITKSICQLFTLKPGTKYVVRPVGSSVLLGHNEIFYCVTNAHILDHINFNKIFAMIGNGNNCSIGGELRSTAPPDKGDRKDDIYDITIVKLDEQTVTTLKSAGYVFLHIDDIHSAYQAGPFNKLLFLGYPISKTKFDYPGNKIILSPIKFLGNPITKEYRSLPFNLATHIMVKYERKNLMDENSNFITGPVPRGLSGSGIWEIGYSGDKCIVQLVGILTEYNDNRSILIGTKIGLVIGAIKGLFDPSIPGGLQMTITELDND